MTNKEPQVPLKFPFYSLRFCPYSSSASSHTSKSALSEVFPYFINHRKKDNGYLIDKNEKRQFAEPRELFTNSAVIKHKKSWIRCSFTVLQDGRSPCLKPNDKFKLLPLDKLGCIVVTTRFFKDFRKASNFNLEIR